MVHSNRLQSYEPDLEALDFKQLRENCLVRHYDFLVSHIVYEKLKNHTKLQTGEQNKQLSKRALEKKIKSTDKRKYTNRNTFLCQQIRDGSRKIYI